MFICSPIPIYHSYPPNVELLIIVIIGHLEHMVLILVSSEPKLCLTSGGAERSEVKFRAPTRSEVCHFNKVLYPWGLFQPVFTCYFSSLPSYFFSFYSRNMLLAS